jgi:hypothetical protein
VLPGRGAIRGLGEHEVFGAVFDAHFALEQFGQVLEQWLIVERAGIVSPWRADPPAPQFPALLVERDELCVRAAEVDAQP